MSWYAAHAAIAGRNRRSHGRAESRDIETTRVQRSDKLILLFTVLGVLPAAGYGCGGGKAVSCDELECEAPAECDDSDSEAICVCPEGYRDINGDGSECQDIDECAEELDDCAENAICTNTQGSYECACAPTAYTGDGKVCQCAEGYVEVMGRCKGEDGTACRRDADCVHGHCVAGICCATACNAPAECYTSQGASCSDGLTCLYPSLPDGSSCDDGDACTADDACVSETCVGGEPPYCDDDNPCTDDSCNSASGCVNENNTDSCDDGDSCTTDDTCDNGECKGGEPPDCDDDNPCTDDSCNSDSGCEHENNTADCDDDDACTTDDTCDDGECEGGEPPDCDDDNLCTDDSCDSDLGCVHADISASCDDDNICTTDSCDPDTGCLNQDNTAECEDGNACTTGDTCAYGACVSGGPRTCDDGKFCTDDSCDPDTGCVFTNKADETACDDGNACTDLSSCEEGRCVGRHLIECDDDNPCTDDSCNTASGCVFANNTADCEEGNACTINDHCVDGECVSGDALVCNDGNVCTNDGCNPSSGCTVVNNKAACDDGNPCTTNDHCSGGLCQNTDPLVCDDFDICTDNDCDPSDFDGDPCFFPHNSAPCDDGHSCTESDVCSAGACTGSGNPCGPNATGCTEEGASYTCICPEPEYIEWQGECVLNTNECTQEPSPCDQDASCFDPTPGLGDAECTCDFGYTGDGYSSAYQPGATGCTDIDECAGDPCGIAASRALSCNQPAPGIYTCTCNTGYTSVDGGSGPTCVCDLNGTFALRIETFLSWEDIQYVQDGSGTNYSWAILNQNYLSDGTLQIETVACGGVTPDLCGTGIPFFGVPPQAYSQFSPMEIYTLPPVLPTVVSEMSLPLALAGTPYLTPLTATISGIHLADPLGPWPASRRNVSEGPFPPGGGYEWTNQAMWVDHDEDGNFGVTSYAVPPGGAGTLTISTDPPVTATPPFTYQATSPVCTRGGDHLPYNWFPSSYFEWVKRFHVASRLISQFSGTIQSCDLIDGAVIGPNTGANEGQFLAQVRVHSCIRCQDWQTDRDCEDRACESTIVNEYDTMPQDAQTIESSSFIIKRIPSDSDCADVRAMSFP